MYLNRKRAVDIDIGGKAQLEVLREAESQDYRCCKIDEMEKLIGILTERLIKLHTVSVATSTRRP